MKYFVAISERKSGRYYYYRSNYRKNGKVKTHQIYLGPEKRALRIISDFSSKKPENEKLLSYSGELILSKIANQCQFEQIINQTVKNNAQFNVGKFIQIVTIERTLYNFSKWRLANKIHQRSSFSLDSVIQKENFSEDNIYNYMDYIFPHLQEVQFKLLEHIQSSFHIAVEEVILDGTSVACYGKDEKEEEEGSEGREQEETLRRLKGYSRDKRPDLPQINFMLGINRDYIPLLFETFSGNTSDVTMFEKTLRRIQTSYPFLWDSARKCYLIFDRGNNNPQNIEEVDLLCQKWSVYFVAGIRSTMVKSELMALAEEDLPEIYSHNQTTLFGKTITKQLYNKERYVLLYFNPGVKKRKTAKFLARLETLEKAIAKILQEKKTEEEKQAEIKALLRKYHLITCFSIQILEDRIKFARVEKKIKEKVALFGKFAIITSNLSLGAPEIMRLYKAKDKIEQEFHIFKSVFDLCPVFHSRPDRIQTHFAIVVWGVLFCAILKLVLQRQNIDFSFEGLMETIKEGKISIGDYIYPDYKWFRLKKTLNITPELEQVFQILKLKHEYFDIEVDPTMKDEKRGEDAKK